VVVVGVIIRHFLFLFIQVQNVAHFFWILMVFEFFVAILETPPCLLLLAKTLHLLFVLQLLIKYAKMSVSLGNQLRF
jgi:hypothetical protein